MAESINLFNSFGGAATTRTDEKTGKTTITSEIFAKQLKAVEDARDAQVKVVDDKITQLTKKTAAISEFETHLKTLLGAANNLQTKPNSIDSGIFAQLTATGYGTRSDTVTPSPLGAVIQGKITPEATTTSFSLEVLKKASNHLINATQSLPDETAQNGAAFTLQLSVDDLDYTDVEILPTDSLKDIQNKVNAVSAETGVKALVSYIDGAYTLAMQAVKTGSVMYIKAGTGSLPNYIPQQTDESLVASTETDLENHQIGLLAEYTFNGLTGTSKVNTITPTDGVTLTLQKAEPGSVYQVDVQPDKEAILKAFQDFEVAYNNLNALIIQHSLVGEDGEILEGSELYGSPLLRTVKSELYQLLVRRIDDNNGSDFSHLTEIGMKRNETTGNISFDLDAIGTFIDEDFSKFKRLFDFEATSSHTKMGLVEHPVSIPQGMLADSGIPITTHLSVTKDGSTYTAEITFDSGPYVGNIYTIEVIPKVSNSYVYFNGADARLNGEPTTLLAGFKYFIKDEGSGFPMEADITMNEGVMKSFAQRINNMFDLSKGDLKLYRDSLATKREKFDKEKHNLETKYAKIIERKEKELGKLQGALKALEGIAKYAEAFSHSQNQ